MKQTALVSLGLQILFSLIYCAAFAWLGYSENILAFYATNPIWFLLFGFVLFLVLLFQLIYALMNSRNQLWMKCAMVAFFAFFLIPLQLRPAHGFLISYGLMHRMSRDYGFDNMRHFALEVSHDFYIADHDRDFYCIRGDYSFLPKNRQLAYDQLRQKYTFLKWGGDGLPGPSVSKSGDVIKVYWAAWFGHWGFSVADDGKMNDADPDDFVVRASDDIYFYMD